MSLLALARRRGSLPPLAPPYNAATYIDVPTPDATGHTTHPSVLDMVAESGALWNGYRYWMAHTPYSGFAVALENPCILASNDKTTWVTPDGLTNPIDPWPGGDDYNSDPDLIWEPTTETMVCYWRDYLGGSGVPDNLVFCYSTSTDGSTWTTQTDALDLTFPTSGGIFSPAILRVGPGDWRMWLVDDNGTSHVRTATSYAGSWSAPTALTFNGTVDAGVAGGLWHWDIIEHGGTFYGLVIANRSTDAANIYAMTSADGITWALNTTPVLQGRADWDRQLYRPTLTMGSGGRVDVWYSAYSAGSDWRIGYTEIPLTEWPEPPA